MQEVNNTSALEEQLYYIGECKKFLEKKTIELLAPAGSWEAVEAAVNAGADAVYMGGKAFGARAYASNFDEEEMAKAVYFAHMHHVRLYITVNT